ncbi:MAG: linear amide C-N hydrolase [Candidatus Aminicenantes bacterium]|nr:MAG: linear amide C-N hydrolase [Candidatus Aminicenantes bacterium]
MHRKTVFLITLSIVLLLGTVSDILPCQTFTLKKGSILIVGHNLGARNHVPGLVVINKRGVRKTAVSWKELLSGKPASNPPFEWISKYGSVTFNPFCRDFPDGGMNEAGLFIEEMTLDGTRFPVDESKPLLFMMLWMQYILDSFETVEQVVQSVHDLTIDGWTWHFFTADRKGNSAVIEFLDGEINIFKGKDLPFPVLCNTKYVAEVKNIKRYKDFGGDKAIDLKSHRQQRFIHGAQMIRDFDPEKDDAVDYGFKILNQFDRGGTQWSFVCDLKNLKAYFRSKASKKIKELDLKSFGLSCRTSVKVLDYHSDLEGNVEKNFTGYSLKKNRDFLKTAISALGKGFESFLTAEGSTIEEVISRLAGYSEKTSCTK